MSNKQYPNYEKHSLVNCFECNESIGDDKPLFYGFPRGAYAKWCNKCKVRTYYDTEDASIKFDAKGDPLDPSCNCGCTVPQDQWDTSDGWPRCPECQYI